MAGKLTTHVLDTARGIGADGLQLTLRRLAPDLAALGTMTLKDGGRATLLEGADFVAGTYEIVFRAASYQSAQGIVQSKPAFLDEIPIRFGVDEPDTHYHIPLILSPFGYSTYRGG